MVGFFMFSTLKTYAQTATAPSAGDGTEVNPYEIANLENLYWLSQNTTEWDKHYIQTADIDASVTIGWDNDSGFTPIGNTDIQFAGTYNGQSHSIESLFIDRPGINGVGLFGYISGTSVVISNLILNNVNITGENWTGGVVGRNVDASIEKVASSGQVAGDHYVGGIVGHSTSGFIKYSYSSTNVSADFNEAGGLAGKYKYGSIQNSFAHGDVTANESVGGFVGYLYMGSINNCYSTGAVNGNRVYSGFIGNHPNGTATNCFYDKETSGQSTGKGATGLTTAEMKDVMNYLDAGWDFVYEEINGTDSYWGINDTDNNAYPFLWWQGYTSINVCYMPIEPVTNIVVSKSYDKIAVESYEDDIAEGYVIFINDTVNFPSLTKGDNPEVNTVWQNEGQQCFYSGTSNNPQAEISGLTHYLQYFIKIYPYYMCEGERIYENNGKIVSIVLVKSEIPEGDGSNDNPYLIETFEHLVWMCNNEKYWSKTYKQIADINASDTYNWCEGKGFLPIGDDQRAFKGNYFGNGHIIDSLYINRPDADNIGLFGYTYDSWIKEIGITNLHITGNDYVGGLVGKSSESAIQRTFTTGSIIGQENLGGIAGYFHERELQDSYSHCTISGDRVIGGIAGYVNNGACLRYCYCTGEISGNQYISGGVYGYKRGYYTYILNCAFDSETTGCGGSLGKTTEEMKTKETFTDMTWEFAESNEDDNYKWAINDSINNGYPFLQWQWKGPKPIIQELDTIIGSCSVSVDAVPEAITIFGDTIAGVTESSLSYSAVGEYLITWVFEGVGDKNSVQDQLVIVVDNDAPIPDLESLDDITDECSVTISNIPTATDNCSGTITATTDNELEYTGQGTYTITWTYADGNGNVSTQEQTVIIDDAVAPEITNIENQEFEVDAGSTYYTVSGDELDIKEYSDNCEIGEITNDFNDSNTLEGAEIPEGAISITWTVKDNAGNTKSCTYSVTVNNTATAIHDISKDGIIIYPNPVSDKLSVVSDYNKVKCIDIYDLTGNLMYSKANVSETEKIDFSQFNSGVYIISIKTDNLTFTRKVLKK